MEAVQQENGATTRSDVLENKPRRGRPSRAQAQAIDRRVLDAARYCFLTNGVAGATMEAIARRARVTKATLYQRYADKVALLRAMMQERVETWSLMAQQREAPRGETLEGRLRYFARSALHWSENAEVKAFGNLIRECWGSARLVAEEMQAIRDNRMIDVLEQQMEEFGAKEGLVIENPRQLAAIFMGMLTAFQPKPALGGAEPSEHMIANYADEVVDILFSGRAAWQKEHRL
ncbi:TetR family transcriptional regulator [Novosphingobium sp. PhB165]|uniref:TetR/AcrR family transcriptional regulator n=1 Tax=Novosphingobium sp. PhB165 TaxID=2485105 RepID=UPI001045DAE9|nr:TetR/AcrR family transcriptional regulator [Novosphingobium sp. PhB165]TCM14227.1 TetR family transcriptional regulator [Novosphingobium sp. PhB165]